jgi:site-specific DNA-methyltransferase (adenine-specific)
MIPFPDRKYSVILADPPWGSPYGGKYRWSAKWHYATMATKTIAELPVSEIAFHDCVLLLWATCPGLPDAFEVMRTWGFRYSTVAFSWVKMTRDGRPVSGMGHSTKSSTELCLLGRRGKGLSRVDATVLQVILAPRGRHSQKPAEVRDRIVRLYGDVPRIELFARQRVLGWDCWGSEAPPE